MLSRALPIRQYNMEEETLWSSVEDIVCSSTVICLVMFHYVLTGSVRLVYEDHHSSVRMGMAALIKSSTFIACNGVIAAAAVLPYACTGEISIGLFHLITEILPGVSCSLCRWLSLHLLLVGTFHHARRCYMWIQVYARLPHFESRGGRVVTADETE